MKKSINIRTPIELADPADIWKDYDHAAAIQATKDLAGLWADGDYPTGDDIRRWRREGSRKN